MTFDGLNSDLFDSLPQPTWIYDTATLRFLEVSRSAVRAYGYSREEFLAMTIADIRPPEDVPALRAFLKGELGEAGQREWRHRRKDGSTFTVEVVAESVTYQGRPARLVTVIDVTDRVRTTEALRQSEQTFRRIADLVPAILWTANADSSNTWVNRQWLELRGTTIDEEAGEGWAAAIHPDDAQRFMEATQEAFKNQAPLDSEFRVKNKEGEYRRLVSRGQPHFAPDGTLLGYVGVCLDITMLRAAQEEAALYAEIVRSMPLGIYVLRLEDRNDAGSLRFIAANPASADVDGLAAQDVVGKTTLEAFPGPQAGAISETLREVVLTGEERDLGQIRYGSDSVQPGIFHLSAFPLPGDHAVVIHRNVTEQVQAVEALTRQKELLQTIFDHIPVMIAVLDAQGRVLAVNREMTRVFGYTVDEIASMDLIAALYPDPETAAKARAFIERADRTWGEFPARVKGGREIQTAWANVRLSDGSIIGIGQDVTERRQLEGQLRQAQRMESVGRLAGGVAHDFNNLLTAILGFTSLAIRDVHPEGAARRSLDEVRKAGERAASLTRQLLVFSRKQVVMPEIVDLAEAVTDMTGMLRRMIGEDVRLHTEVGARGATVRVDRGQIEQVLLNLAVNSRDAMPQGGDLWIQVERVIPAEPLVGADDPDGGRVVLTVRDTGTGMTEMVRAHIFEPFFTTKPLGEGTGLGLATVYGIVQQSGGFIDVETEPGAGTTFRISLPWHSSRGPALPLDDPSAGQSGRETVLLVEDEDAVRKLVAAVLESSGYRVLAAASGEEALEIASDSGHVIDLVLSDIVMPGQNGREIVERIHGIRPDLRHLYMSGYTNDAIVQRGIQTGDSPFIQKPFLPSALLAKVRQTLDARRRPGPPVESR